MLYFWIVNVKIISRLSQVTTRSSTTILVLLLDLYFVSTPRSVVGHNRQSIVH